MTIGEAESVINGGMAMAKYQNGEMRMAAYQRSVIIESENVASAK
jgi:hypothetical protein